MIITVEEESNYSPSYNKYDMICFTAAHVAEELKFISHKKLKESQGMLH